MCLCVCVCVENGVPLTLQVSGDGQRVLLVALSGQVLLWECTSPQELSMVRGATVSGRWSQVHAPSNMAFPSSTDKEAICHSVFIRSQVRNPAASHSTYSGAIKFVNTPK